MTTHEPTIFMQLQDLFGHGGPVLVILAVMSVFALALILLKALQFARLRVGARGFIGTAFGHWRAGRPDEALTVLEASPNPIAVVLTVAVRGLARTDGQASESVREEVLRKAAEQQKRLGAYARGLDAVATLAPLLGLLGTVFGMIEAFRELEAAGGRADPALLAGGIWEALLTTAAGLSIAIASAAALHWIEGIVEQVRHDTEDAVTRLFTGNLQG
ncbi:MAG: MotA/TolQ/ExbB proton channel family protein [Gammaproteobacteria bacterium]|nr:MotA/TolQ/ExbB proton channel family protein [Gammaproteobacteria bacterium]NNJ84819.1 MotA/TolQ/ExbB proton channel family protein [Gammaproteobacteria bacterium]